MTSIKVKFRPSSLPNSEGAIYYQIIHERKTRQIPSGYKIFPSEWDEEQSSLAASAAEESAPSIRSIRQEIRSDIDRLKRILSRLEASGLAYTADDIADEFARYRKEYSLFNYMEVTIIRLRQTGRVRTAEAHLSALHSFKHSREGRDIMLDSLDSEAMETYQAWLRARGVVPNTISFYMRILRSLYNRAVEENITENRQPFRHVFTRVDKTVKRALPIAILRKIKNLDLEQTPRLDYARDMFLMSFYLRGMSFIDMAFLKKSDLKNGRIVYRRHKTRQQLIIKWTREMQQLLDKYPENRSDYLLPIIREPFRNERSTYRNAAYRINYCLKTIAEKLGLAFPLTLYVARHSWASAAKAKGIPLSLISEGMGHDSEATTRIYLANLDCSTVDKANAAIIKSL